MTNHDWINFAGFLNGCIHQLEHEHCPFKKYMQMDQHQRLEFLLAVSDLKANAMIKSCLIHQEVCKPIVVNKRESSWDLSLITTTV